MNRNFRHPRFRATQSFKQYALSTSDMEALQAVADKYGMKSFDELKALTHEMVANKRAWNSEGRIVNNPTMAFEDFFEEEDDALSGAFEDMLETDALRKVFGTSMRRLSLSIEMSLARFFVFLVTLRPCFHSHSYGQFLPDAGWGPKSSSGAAICPTGFSPKPISAVARGRIRLCLLKFVALCSSCFVRFCFGSSF